MDITVEKIGNRFWVSKSGERYGVLPAEITMTPEQIQAMAEEWVAEVDARIAEIERRSRLHEA